MATTEWRKHTGTEMPSELAAAQIVEVEWPFRATPGRYMHIADSLNWASDTFHYRPALTEDGLPYVSAEGLEPETNYVVVRPGGKAFELELLPAREGHSWGFFGDDPLCLAPDTHAIPGDPVNSLAKVWR